MDRMASELADPAQRGRLEHLQRLLDERSAELAWVNERLIEALYQAAAAEAAAGERERLDRASGLPNRQHLLERIEREVRRHAVDGEPAAVIVVGIDAAAHVRDALGLAAGDALARAVGDRLRRTVRGSDAIACIGDDEFALVMPLHRGGDAAALARKLLDALDAPLPLDGRELRLAPSIGVAVLPDDAASADALLARACAAKDYARERRTGGYQFFRTEIAARSARRLRLAAELQEAIERDQFVVELQPRVETRARRLVGAEALVRWAHPERGLLAAEDFLDVAEASGLIVPIGARVLAAACRHASRWRAPLPVAVNLAPREFRGASIVPLVARALNDAGLPAARLQVEVSESHLLAEDGPEAVDALLRLKEGGVGLVLDRAGGGALAALRRVPLDGLKLAGDFVRAAAVDARDGAIVAALAALGKRLGVRVIAGGVETEAQFAFVRKAGCVQAQGYLLGRPLAPDAFAERMPPPRGRRAGA
jgi:diguanylate cyclase (GGDEF)-like protein